MIIGSIVLFIIAYRFAFSETIALYDECNELESKIEDLQTAPEQIALLKSRINKMEQLASISIDSSFSFQKGILNIVGDYCAKNKIALKEVPQVAVFETQAYSLETHQIKLEGAFIPMLKLAYGFEQLYGLGRLSAVHFEKAKDYRTNTDRLYCTLYIQQINKTGHEN